MNKKECLNWFRKQWPNRNVKIKTNGNVWETGYQLRPGKYLWLGIGQTLEAMIENYKHDHNISEDSNEIKNAYAIAEMFLNNKVYY